MSLITLLTAPPENGKTTVALRRLKTRSAIFFVPTALNKNAGLAAIPWANFADLTAENLAALAEKGQAFRIVTTDADAPRLGEFIDPRWAGWAFVFDDLPQMFYTKQSLTHLARFVAGIRHRDGQIIITTQRIKGVIPPFIQINADEITQVGPLLPMEEARILYYMGGSSRYATFKEFYRAIVTNPQYNEFHIKIYN